MKPDVHRAARGLRAAALLCAVASPIGCGGEPEGTKTTQDLTKVEGAFGNDTKAPVKPLTGAAAKRAEMANKDPK